MKKFAILKPFDTVLRILLFISLTAEIFGNQKADYFQKPLLKCWTLNNPLIDSIASDNDLLIAYTSDGNVIRLDQKNSEQIWKTSVGNKGNSKLRLNRGKISVITLENFPGAESALVIRNIDVLSGIVSGVKEIPGVIKEIGVDDINNVTESPNIYLNSAHKFGELDLENDSIDWSPVSLKIEERAIISGSKKFYAYADDSKISLVDRLNKSEIQTIKSQSRQITAINLSNDSLFWGDVFGGVFKKDRAEKESEKILRTGGKISFLQNIGKDILITSNDNYIYLYSPADEKTVWKKRLSGRVSIKPQFYKNLIAVTTNSESDLYFINSENGKTFNRVSLPADTFIKTFQISDSSLFILTNFGLIKFSEACGK